MPSKKQYNLVQNDDYDTRIPLHPEEAFQHGITFQAKYIGTLDVPRPSSRVEIVAAMRRIRYEFKAKGIKKKKVTIDVSVDGVKVTLRKKKKKNQWVDENRLLLLHHPIYRIFYVSHDSQDLKIFSYIARDGSSNVFKCNVFKSNKKSQAMRIVRTVGQAFEVCHKLSIQNATPDQPEEGDSEKGSEPLSEKPRKDATSEAVSETQGDDASTVQERLFESASQQSISQLQGSAQMLGQQGQGSMGQNPGKSNPRPTKLDILSAPPETDSNKRAPLSLGETYMSPLNEPLRSNAGAPLPPAGTPLSIHHEVQLLREQLEQQTQQTQAAIAQVHLLRDQLAAETAARLEAQARTHQLLVHNKELLDHIQTLVLQIQDLEMKLHAVQNPSQGQHQVSLVPQMAIMCDPQTPQTAPVLLPAFQEADAIRQQASALHEQALFENRCAAQGTPLMSPHQLHQLHQLQQLHHSPMPSPRLASTPIHSRSFSYSPQPSPLPYRSSFASYAHQSTLFPTPSGQPTYRTFGPRSASSQSSMDRTHGEEEDMSPFIKPLSQPADLTDGRLRLLVSSTEVSTSSPVLAPRPMQGCQPKRGTSVEDTRMSTEEMIFMAPRPSQGCQPKRGTSVEDTRMSTEEMILMALDDSSESAPTHSQKPEDSGGSGSYGGGGGGGGTGMEKRSANGPSCITRSISEKVPNRSELMTQMQRTAWARHTTK